MNLDIFLTVVSYYSLFIFCELCVFCESLADYSFENCINVILYLLLKNC